MEGEWKKMLLDCRMIERIIRDKVYTGILVQLKTKTETVGGRQIKKSKEEWVRVENTHEAIVSYSKYIKAVSSLKQQATLYLDREKLSKQVIKRNSSLSVGVKINALVKAMETAQQRWMVLYDKYADGKLDRNNFISEKKKYDAEMKRMEEELAALRQRQKEEPDVQQDSGRNAAEALGFLEENELIEDMKDKLIEIVMVYAEGRLEIVWKFENNALELSVG